MNIATRSHLSRRSFFRSAGASLALPWLDAMIPAFARSAESAPPRRMIGINIDLGFIPDRFFPRNAGRGYELSPYLREIAEFRDQFTVFSGLHHPETGGQHASDRCFLTGARHPARPGFKNSLSLDQRIAEEIGHLTRLPSLSLRTGPGSESLSYTADGVRVPAINRPSEVYRLLFVQGSPLEVERQIERLRNGRSLMDGFGEEIRRLERGVSPADRTRLDQYFSSVRELEKKLEIQQAWAARPKPEVTAKPPRDNTSPGGVIPKTEMMFEMAKLALQTDSTRAITILVNQTYNPKVDLPGVDAPHHALTHQTSRPDSADELAIIETAQMRALGKLLRNLAAANEGHGTLLDHTSVLQGSNLGDAARHDGSNLPILLAGGGFKHGQHLAFDAKHNKPLANVFVSLLQRMGIETDRFSSSTGTVAGLEPA